ncbi:DEAD-box ATP-dependent RNA helicase 31-like isoform X2 [Lycium ferocissimum]|uniref:DEAD-box ATP-dependent RNA helicase 31-like isoform X2 n=1 Tax=Lycium ferocissimum TaxID=112874 RepID=UPI002814EDFD|nr:DEAD-box ATP-dependent RNA helicase 31-like isoform X2 [Lycium ferocissimum]
MPVKLLPQLRLFNSTIPFTHFPTMKCSSTLKPKTVPVFSRMFPHKLKYRSIGFPILPAPGQQELRKFSTRSGRPGSGSGPVSKSLIEDEAELSDWVSGLRSDSSFKKTQVYSDSDDNEERGRGKFGNKRSRDDDDDDDFSGPDRRSGGRGGMQSNSRNGGRFGSEFGGGRGGGRGGMHSNLRGGGRFGNDRGGRSGGRDRMESSTRGGGRFGSEGRGSGGRDRKESSTRGGRFGSEGRGSGGRDRMESSSRGGRFGSDVGRGGSRDRMESFPRKGGRFGSEIASPSESRRGNGRVGSGYGREMGAQGGSSRLGRKEGTGMGRGSSMLLDEDDTNDENESEDEEEENGYKGFRNLIDSEEESEESDEDDEVKDEKVISLEKEDSPRASRPSSSGKSDSHLTETGFDQFPLSPLSLKGVKDAGYKTMTVVQEATLPVILKGKDVLAKAKTGTGKTVAFLLPSIEVVVKSPPNTRDQKRPPVLVLVICPTRELATQAAAEANTLLKYHPSIGVQVVIGGTRLALEQKRMQANPCQILVATPGRLRDHVENTAGFATRLMGVQVLVLDEADHLLDMGFRKEIEKIISAIPKQRQTLLFSATVPPEVRQICHIALKRDHEFINTVEEGSEETHAQVEQMHLVSPLETHFSLLYALLKEHIADDVNYKVLVFCTTAMVTRLVAELLGELNLNVREIHSRKPQSYRTRVSDEFRKSTGLILVSSDVSARGVDYPDVSLVVQIGVPADRQQYIHRLGRTGRKGKEGQGILLLAPWEEYFLSTIKDLPISKAPVPLIDPETKKKVERAFAHIDMKSKETAYQAWLGYYNSNRSIGKDKYRLVELANEFSQTMGLDNPPAIPKLVLGKMGLKNVPGLRSK